jgi:hypothetical protein
MQVDYSYNIFSDLQVFHPHKIIKMKFEEIPRLIQDSGSLIKEHMPRSNDLELIILKGHILLEYILNQIINIKSDNNIEIENTNFSFNQKIEILVILNFIENNSKIFHIL